MDYQTLGNTGLLVSRLCLGTMTFGGAKGIWKTMGALDQAAVDELVKDAIEASINFFDTASSRTLHQTDHQSVKFIDASWSAIGIERIRARKT